MMNVYTKMSYGSTLLVLVLIAALLTGEVWILFKIPKLNPYALHLAGIIIVLAILRWVANRKARSRGED